MSEWQIVLLVSGAAAGGFINGLAGFGTALFALGFWLQFLDPVRAVSIVVVISVITGLQGVWLVRHSILDQPHRLIRFLVPGILGIPIGIASLSFLQPDPLKLAIAALMLLYGGYFIVRRDLPKLETPTPVGDVIVGFFGGILGGAASLSGALPTMWCALRPWTKSETRAVLQPYNVAILGLTAASFAFSGAYDRQSLFLIGVSLPIALITSRIGIFTFLRLQDVQFRKLIISMMFLSGSMLALRTLY